MKKTYDILNIVLILAVLVGDICYMIYGGLWLKGLTSAGFVLLGVINLIYALKNKTGNKKFCITMLIGLAFGMLGDIILNVHFISGAILFAVGHIAYIVAYSFVIKLKWTDLIAGMIIFIPSTLFITLAPIFDFGGSMMEIVCVVYAIIISCMVGKAITNLIKEKSLLNILLVIGSILFFFSDLMLLLDVFANLSGVVGILCLATYYPAQCILAYSLMHAKTND